MHPTNNKLVTIPEASSYYTRKVVNEVLKEFPTLKHIILYGSYGRHEGAWIKVNNEFRPYNDFDIVLVFNSKSDIPTKPKLSSIRKKLAKNLDVKWVDISLKSKSSLKNVRNSIYGSDLKNGSTVIYGDPAILNLIPYKSTESIKLQEGEVLFFTRLWTFCGSVKKLSNLKEDEARFFRNQMAKAVLAAVDTILLMQKGYHHSYKERERRVLLLPPTQLSTKERELIKWAFQQKKSPQNEALAQDQIEDIYKEVAIFYRKFMLIALSSLHRKDFKTIIDFKRFYKTNLKVNLKRLLYIGLKRSFLYEKIYWSNIIQMNVLAIICSEKGSLSLIQECMKSLKKIGCEAQHSIESIRSSVAKVRESI